jgi:hypothetical protein
VRYGPYLVSSAIAGKSVEDAARRQSVFFFRGVDSGVRNWSFSDINVPDTFMSLTFMSLVEDVVMDSRECGGNTWPMLTAQA